jgi:hypothetical protein
MFFFLLACLAVAFTPFMALRHFADLRRAELPQAVLAGRGRATGYMMAVVSGIWTLVFGMSIWNGEYRNEPIAHFLLQSVMLWGPGLLAGMIAVAAFKSLELGV